MSGPADNDKRFERVLTSFLRENLEAPRQNCPHPGLLSAYFDGKLSEPEARELEFHLSGCSTCQAELAALVRLQPEPAPEATQEDLVPAPPALATPSEPSPGAAINEAPAEVIPFKPKRRRTLWVWIAPFALAASAVLAISLTHRFAPLIDQASQRSRESGVGVRERGSAPPLTARRDEDTRAKEALSVAPAAPTTAASPAAPQLLDEMEGAESKATPPDSALPQNGEAVFPGQQAEPEAASPTAPAPPGTPYAEPNEAARTKQAPDEQQQLERRPADRAAPLAEAPANQRASAFAKAAKPAAEHATVIVARTNHQVVWRLGEASIERSDDAGKTWRAQSSGDVTGLLGGSAPSPEVCWLAGRNGLMLRTIDGGEHWERLTSPTAGDLSQVIAANAGNATVETSGGERFFTRDGGRNWSMR